MVFTTRKLKVTEYGKIRFINKKKRKKIFLLGKLSIEKKSKKGAGAYFVLHYNVVLDFCDVFCVYFI